MICHLSLDLTGLLQVQCFVCHSFEPHVSITRATMPTKHQLMVEMTIDSDPVRFQESSSCIAHGTPTVKDPLVHRAPFSGNENRVPICRRISAELEVQLADFFSAAVFALFFKKPAAFALHRLERFLPHLPRQHGTKTTFPLATNNSLPTCSNFSGKCAWYREI